MSKKTALYLMIAGVALTVYDMTGDGGKLYGPGKPLESLRWEVYKKEASGTTAAKSYYISASDMAAIAGAYFYFR